jgi:hypothetical protein
VLDSLCNRTVSRAKVKKMETTVEEEQGCPEWQQWDCCFEE